MKQRYYCGTKFVFLFSASPGPLASVGPDNHSVPSNRQLGGWMEEDEGEEEETINKSASDVETISEVP